MSLEDQGSPSKPFHHAPHTWEEESRQLDEHIRESAPFEGKWQSYVDGYALVIPEPLREYLDAGGVVTVSTERHLMVFGTKHWLRMQRILAKQVGLSPVNNELARHIYSHAYRFRALNQDGTIDLPLELVEYAGITKQVAILGMIYYAEVHNIDDYNASEKAENRESLLARFRKMRFN